MELTQEHVSKLETEFWGAENNEEQDEMEEQPETEEQPDSQQQPEMVA